MSRHHEKVISIDNVNYIGSANFADKYGGYKYGMNYFWDINYKLVNVLGTEIRSYFLDIANIYNINLHKQIPNK